MSELADLLIELYPDRRQAALLLRQIDMEEAMAGQQDGSPPPWERILMAAWVCKKALILVGRVGNYFPDRADELHLAAQEYLESWEPASVAGASVTVGDIKNVTGSEIDIAARDIVKIYYPDTEQKPVTLIMPRLLRFPLETLFPRLDALLTRMGVLAEPPEREVFNLHMRALYARIRTEMREKTYLPLQGIPIPSSGALAREMDVDPFVSPIHQVILQILGKAHGGDSISAQIAVATRKSRVVKNILRLLDYTHSPLILLGEPGSGKTMTLQQAAMLMAERESKCVFPVVPIYVRLGEFHVEDGPIEPSHVKEFVLKNMPASLRSYYGLLEANDRLVIFFDGMDEMSRHRYSEHTRALSEFASYSRAKTLFSCRITDFSPDFEHHRLVLLPFNRSQTEEYLGKYIKPLDETGKAFPVTIGGKQWTQKGLARYIVQGELPIEANNPFVLWLLCLYTQSTGNWPDSRVQLLLYYNEQNYRRKAQETSPDDPPLPPMEEVFGEWARTAYLITERNRGPAIPFDLLQTGADDQRLEAMLWAGKRCGVLRESKEKYTQAHLVRFEHHRFQEFFSAYHIHNHHIPINWLDKLDAPRWQETMLNLILLGEPATILTPFIKTVEEQTLACNAEVARQRQEAKGKAVRKKTLINSQIVLPNGPETALADRVELAARIMYQCGPKGGSIRSALMPPFRKAIDVLANYGSPIAQVKMMRTCQTVPEIDFIEALRTPLNSKVRWVRDQAILLIGSSQASGRAVGSDLATEIGFDLSNGFFVTRLPAYWKAVHTSPTLSHAWSLFSGILGYALQLILLLISAGVLYYGMWNCQDIYYKSKPNNTQQSSPIDEIITNYTNFWVTPKKWEINLQSINLYSKLTGNTQNNPTQPQGMVVDLSALAMMARPDCILLTILVVAAAYAIALKSSPSLQWAMILYAGIVSPFLYVSGLKLWLSSTISAVEIAGFFVVLLAAVFPLIGLLTLLGYIAQLSGAGLYLAITWHNRHYNQKPLAFARSIWQSGSYQNTLLVLTTGVGYFVILGIIGILTSIFYLALLIPIGGLFEWTGELLHLPFYPLVNGLLVYIPLTLLVVILVRSRQSGFWVTVQDIFRSIVKWNFSEVLSCFLVFVIMIAALFVILFFDWLLKHFDLYCMRGGAILILLLFTFLVYRFLRSVMNSLIQAGWWFFRYYPSGYFTEETWKMRLAEADPDRQRYLLEHTNPQSLKLTAAQYLDLLIEVQGLIKDDPAASQYWEQRDRLQEALRQERQG